MNKQANGAEESGGVQGHAPPTIYASLDYDTQMILARSIANRVAKGIIKKGAGRSLDSIMVQLRKIEGRLDRAARNG
jgi:hypothetical protein